MSKRILVVDDSDLNRLFVREHLEGAGFQVSEAPNGEECLKQVSEQRPDLVIMDVVMPEMNGWDLCTRVKHAIEPDSLPIIILTSKDQDHDMLRSYECGADEFLTKPIDPGELLASVQKLLGENTAA